MNTTSTIVKQQSLPVMEAFYTLQGEGFHQGRAAYFIRLGGCDVGCVWCDVKDSWDASKHPLQSVTDIVSEAKKYPGRLAVITGGEPLMHQLDELTHAFSGDWDWICLSPKKFKAPLPEIIPLAHELKVVIFNKHDFDWAETYAAQVNPNCKLYLQPEWDKAEKVLPLIIDYIKAHPQWELSLQTHKYINVP